MSVWVRRDRFSIRPLSEATRKRYADEWREVQSAFVDRPDGSLRGADLLVVSVMRDRGYPMDDFETSAADISVDHPYVVQNYRAAHAISEASDRGDVDTESLRQGMVYYRMLFEELLADDAGSMRDVG
jgi:hypothetical protein